MSTHKELGQEAVSSENRTMTIEAVKKTLDSFWWHPTTTDRQRSVVPQPITNNSDGSNPSERTKLFEAPFKIKQAMQPQPSLASVVSHSEFSHRFKLATEIARMCSEKTWHCLDDATYSLFLLATPLSWLQSHHHGLKYGEDSIVVSTAYAGLRFPEFLKIFIAYQSEDPCASYMRRKETFDGIELDKYKCAITGSTDLKRCSIFNQLPGMCRHELKRYASLFDECRRLMVSDLECDIDIAGEHSTGLHGSWNMICLHQMLAVCWQDGLFALRYLHYEPQTEEEQWQGLVTVVTELRWLPLLSGLRQRRKLFQALPENRDEPARFLTYDEDDLRLQLEDHLRLQLHIDYLRSLRTAAAVLPAEGQLVKFQTPMAEVKKTILALNVRWAVHCAAALCGAGPGPLQHFDNMECCAPAAEQDHVQNEEAVDYDNNTESDDENNEDDDETSNTGTHYYTGHYDVDSAPDSDFKAGYLKGRDVGYIDGHIKGHHEGREIGYIEDLEGFNDSRRLGYNEGLEEGEKRGHQAGYYEGVAAGFQHEGNEGNNSSYFRGFTAGYRACEEDGKRETKQECSNQAFEKGYGSGKTEGMATGEKNAFEIGRDLGLALGMQIYEHGLAAGKACPENYKKIFEEGYAKGKKTCEEGGQDGAWDDGHEKGYDEGWDNGYDAGYRFGDELGQKKGYRDGQKECRDHNHASIREEGREEGYSEGYKHGQEKHNKCNSCDPEGYQVGSDKCLIEAGEDDHQAAMYDSGYEDGYDDGYGEGYDEGFEDGRDEDLPEGNKGLWSNDLLDASRQVLETGDLEKCSHISSSAMQLDAHEQKSQQEIQQESQDENQENRDSEADANNEEGRNEGLSTDAEESTDDEGETDEEYDCCDDGKEFW